MRVIINMLRVPNLLMIALLFFILRYLVFIPVYVAYSIKTGITNLHFQLMVVATILIASAGYIANDYFDVETDSINKPQKQYIGKQLTSGGTLAMALAFSLLAVILAFWLSVVAQSKVPAGLLLLALSVAWWYALRLKKSLLWGNIAVACMTSGTIVMAWLIEIQCSAVADEPYRIITGIVTAVSIFALLLSLIREIVKDMEDIEGDKLINCRSLPIVKGIPFTKRFLLICTAITFVLLIVAQVYLFQFSRIIAAIWLLVFVEIPLVYFALALKKAITRNDFHKLSTWLKWIMLGGFGAIAAGQL
ncbi:MAG: geranylgeranylglycerol-phosphate geranylgeranyltransferase [Bacteroidota bacterium]